MTMTDPIADMLTRIRNANVAMHDEVRMPASKLKENLAGLLQKEGYIEGFYTEDNPDRPGRSLVVTMKYSPERERVISGVKRVSKPGLRVYSPAKQIPRVRNGLGIAIVSTSRGIMTGRAAYLRNLGGEVMAEVW